MLLFERSYHVAVIQFVNIRYVEHNIPKHSRKPIMPTNNYVDPYSSTSCHVFSPIGICTSWYINLALKTEGLYLGLCVEIDYSWFYSWF